MIYKLSSLRLDVIVLPDRAAVEDRKIPSTIRFGIKTELKQIPSISDEEISKLRDAPWDAQTREIAAVSIFVRILSASELKNEPMPNLPPY
jgi:hypothetical protein